MTHRELVNLTHNWQRSLTDLVFKACLVSKDYMQIKNALLLLNRCVKVGWGVGLGWGGLGW